MKLHQTYQHHFPNFLFLTLIHSATTLISDLGGKIIKIYIHILQLGSNQVDMLDLTSCIYG